MRRAFAVLLLTLAPLAVLAPATAAAPTGLDVGLTGFRDIVVDQAHGHVFVSQGTSTVVVTDLAGTPAAPLTGLTGAAGMALSNDGSTLYVGLSTGDAIAAVDTTTLAVTTYPTGAGTCPSSLALTAGRVWFGGACDGQWGSIRALDPATGAVTGSLASVYSPVLASSAGADGGLYVVENGLSPTTLYAYDATGGETPTLTLRTSRWDTGSNARDLAVTPDGTAVIQASGYPYVHQAFSTNDLSSVGTYPTTNYPNAVAVRADGLVAAGVDGTYSDDVFLFDQGTDTKLRSYETGSLQTRGLAFGDSLLYAVAQQGAGLRLVVLDPEAPLPVATSLALATDKANYLPGETAHVTATLTGGPADAQVSITQTGPGGTTDLGTHAVDASGQVHVDAAVDAGTSFAASYAGDAGHDPSTATTTVTTSQGQTSLALTSDRAAYGYGATAHVGVALSGPTTGRTVSLYKTVNGVKSLVKTGTVPVGGRLTADITLNQRTTFSATYAGTAQWTSASATRTVTVGARITAAMTRYRYRDGGYYVYRAGDRVYYATNVLPSKAGKCVYLHFQFLVSGVWGHDRTTACFRLDSSSRLLAYFPTDSTFKGHALRIRTEWRGDTATRATNGPWVHAKFR